MIKGVAFSILFYSMALSALLFYFFSVEMGLSAAFGGALMLFNFLGLVLMWKIIFYKKSIALGVLVIIFKYSILGYILWFLPQFTWIRPLGFIAGLSSLLVGIISAMILKLFLKKQSQN